MNRILWMSLLATAAATMTAALVNGGAAEKPTEVPSNTVKTRVLSDVQSVGPQQVFHIVALFEIPKHWHTYWKNPGSGAASTEVTVAAPEGFVVGEPKYSRPRVIPSELGDMFGYEERAAIFVPITAPATLSAGEAKFTIEMNWAVCKDICLMEDAVATLALPTRSETTQPDPAASEIQILARQLPRPLQELNDASASFNGQMLLIRAPLSPHAKARFIPLDSPGVVYGTVTTSIRDGAIQLSVPVEINPDDSLGRPMIVGGLLALDEKPDDPCYEFSMPVASP